MNLLHLWSLGIAEFRTCRRSVGAWVIVAIACAVTLVHWQSLAIHYTYSALISPVHGLIGPRFTFPEIGSTMLLMFSIGIIFLASDIRSRDTRNRISEVLDSQPVGDIEAVIGRLVGLVMYLAISAVFLTLAIFAYGVLAEEFNFSMGTPIEPYSVLAFLVWDIVPNLVLWGSLAVLLAQVIKVRILALLMALVLLGSAYFLTVVIPNSDSFVLSMHSNANVYPSELAPTFVTLIDLVNRFLMVALSGGFLALSALLQARNQSSKTFTQLLFFGGFATLFALSGATSYLIGHGRVSQSIVETWTYAHKQEQLHSNTDIHLISGSINLRPGRSISLDLALTMESVQEKDGTNWLFSLNPGYRITDLSVNGSPSDDYTFEDGLLSIPRDESKELPKIRIAASGKPDERFAYLDSSLDWNDLNAISAKRLYLLGQKSYIFHQNFVALMPTISWIPASGSAYGVGNLESRPRDFFFLDVEVTVPKGWLIAGPGSRDLLNSSSNSTYRLRTRNPIPEFALVSSKFEQRSINVDGVEYELLLNQKHTGNLHTFNKSVPLLREWLSEQSSRLSDIGIRYPYARLSLVEVPSSLRIYGGGWRMDSVYSAPGIQMVRESGFPVAPFDQWYSQMRDYFGEQETRFQRHLLDQLVEYFADDLHGSDPLSGIPKNFVDYQTAPTGKGATALKYVVDQLVLRISTRNVNYFSVHTAISSGSGSAPRRLIRIPNTFGTGIAFKRNWREEHVNRPSVWDLVEETPLDLLDFPADPKNAFHALVLKGQRVADALIDAYGEELVAQLLNQLVDQFRGESYTTEDFHQTARSVGVDVEAQIGDWLSESDLPGFFMDDLRVVRLQNDEEGRTLYQTSFILGNNESVPGVLNVSYQLRDRIGLFWEPIPLEPVRIPGNSTVRVAFQDNSPTQLVWLEPRLAFNRDPIRLDFPEPRSDNPSDAPIDPYVTQIDWYREDKGEIEVDDLDEGFSIENLPSVSGSSTVPNWLKYIAAVPEPDFDKDLPVLNRTNQIYQFDSSLNPLFNVVSGSQLRESRSWWYRDSDPTSYGKYRRTYAGRSEGLDRTKPTFSTTLTSAGKWKLEFHMPAAIRTENSWGGLRSPDDLAVDVPDYVLGTYIFHIVSGESHSEVEFNAGTSLPGWNEIGTFDLSNSEVEVVLTEVSHGLAVADAIRWTPL